MARKSRIFPIVLCVLVLLSMVPLPNLTATTLVDIYGYIHLDDGDSVTQIPNYPITIIDDRTGMPQEVYTDQYGFFSHSLIEPEEALYTDTLTLTVLYFDPETQTMIDNSTTILITPCMRADPTFELLIQECNWYEDIDAPQSGFPPHSDETVTDLYFSQEFAFEGDDVTIYANIMNIGDANFIDTVGVRFYNMDISQFLGEDFVSGLSTDETETVQIEWFDVPRGTHTIRSIVNDPNQFPEINMGNNYLSSKLPVLTIWGDYDLDGLPNWDEYWNIGTSPIDPDTDKDGLPDGWEYFNDLSPLDNGKIDPINGPDGDPDEDNLINLYEYLNTFDSDGNPSTDPWEPDTDGDGFLDYEELNGISVSGGITSWVEDFGREENEDWYVEQSDKDNIFGLEVNKYVSSPFALGLETTSAGYVYSNSPPLNIDLSSDYSISFYFRLENDINKWLDVVTNGHIKLVIYPTNDLRYMNGDGSTISIEQLSLHKWYYIQCIVDTSLTNYEVKIDMNSKESGITFYNTNGLNYFRFGSMDGKLSIGKAYWDNILIQYTSSIIAITDPSDLDTDDDSLNDNDEINIYGTDPSDYDTDDDSFLPYFDFNDGTEIQYWEVQKSCSPSEAGLRANNMDFDQDQLSDGFELFIEFDPTVYQISNVKWQLDTLGKIHVVWQDKPAGSSYYEIYYKNNVCPSGWNTEVQLTDSPDADDAHSVQPRISLDNTKVYIEWMEVVDMGGGAWDGRWFMADSIISGSYAFNPWHLSVIYNYDTSTDYTFTYPSGGGSAENIFPEPLPYAVAVNLADFSEYWTISPIDTNEVITRWQPEPLGLLDNIKVAIDWATINQIKEYIEDWYPGRCLEDSELAYEYTGPIPDGEVILAILKMKQEYEGLDFRHNVSHTLPLPGDPNLIPPFSLPNPELPSITIEDYDYDSDGLSNFAEDDPPSGYGTDPYDPDSDDDFYAPFTYQIFNDYTFNDGDERNYWDTEFPGGVECNFDGDSDGLNNLLDPDSDNDEMWDGWELYYGFLPYDNGDNDYSKPGLHDGDPEKGPEGDPDHDGLKNKEEFNLKTNPLDPDTDNDGLWDGWHDTIDNEQYDAGSEFKGEVSDPEPPGGGGYGSNPIKSDTDGDGLWDGWHDNINLGHWDASEEKGEIGDPCNNGAGGYGTCPTATGFDDDGDGLIDEDPINNHNDDYDGSRDEDPDGYDSDEDGVNDWSEIQYITDYDWDGDGYNSQVDFDSDEDGIIDGKDRYTEDSDGDGWCNANDIDSDQEGLPDAQEDYNKDGILDITETNPYDPDTDHDNLDDWDEKYVYLTNPRIPDSDTDGLDDGAELSIWNNEVGQNAVWIDYDGGGEYNNLLDFDADEDALLDGDEIIYGTDMNNQDSDGEGLLDGEEIIGWDRVINDNNVRVYSNPLKIHTDGDGLTDLEEVNGWDITIDKWGYSPVTEHVDLNPYLIDTDGDSLNDNEEKNLGINPGEIDTDNGGMVDNIEVNYGFDPTNGDDDGLDSDNDGLVNREEQPDIDQIIYEKKGPGGNVILTYQNYGTQPDDGDTDDDLLWDGTEVLYWDTVDINDPNNHNEWSHNYDGDVFVANVGNIIPLWKSFFDNLHDWDSDNDGLADGFENLNRNSETQLDPTNRPYYRDAKYDYDETDPTIYAEPDPSDPDTEGDGVVDGDEAKYWEDTDHDGFLVNARDPDSDGDGVNDNLDIDPLIDLAVTVVIKEIDAEDIDIGIWGDNDYSVKITIYLDESQTESETRISPTWENKDHIDIDPDWEAPYVNIPDDLKNVPIRIKLTEVLEPPDDIIDISQDGDDLDIIYYPKKGTWSGEDSIGDYNGHGLTSGFGDDEGEYAGKLWFDIYNSEAVHDKWAILVAPIDEEDSKETAFRNDIRNARRYLIDKGWTDDAIFYLTLGNDEFVDGDATYDNFIEALNIVAARAKTTDTVFIMFSDHGGGYRDAYGHDENYGYYDNDGDEDDDSYCSREGGGDSENDLGKDYDEYLQTKTNNFIDDDLRLEINDIQSEKMVILISACFSGGFLEDLSNGFTANGRIILAGAPENDVGYYYKYHYTKFANFFFKGLKGDASDTNGNGKIDIEEAFTYAHNKEEIWVNIEGDTESDDFHMWDSDTSNNFYLE